MYLFFSYLWGFQLCVLYGLCYQYIIIIILYWLWFIFLLFYFELTWSYVTSHFLIPLSIFPHGLHLSDMFHLCQIISTSLCQFVGLVSLGMSPVPKYLWYVSGFSSLISRVVPSLYPCLFDLVICFQFVLLCLHFMDYGSCPCSEGHYGE